MFEKFNDSLEDINKRFEFLRIPLKDLVVRVKLMALTNELPNSFFNSGYLQTNSQVYKKFLEKRADNLPKKQEYFDEYSKLRREARAFDSSKGLSPEDLVEIDRFFNEKFPRVSNKDSTIAK